MVNEAESKRYSQAASAEQNREDEVDNGKVEKKLKVESPADPEEQDIAINKSSFDSLPPEMLMKILKNLTFPNAVPFEVHDDITLFTSKRLIIKNLLACRLVNKKWSCIASEILKSVEYLEIQIDCCKESGNLLAEGEKEKETLSNFIKCFDQSKNVPYSRFRCQVDNSTFDNKDWLKFLSDFRENFKCLKLEIKSITNDDELIKWTKKLKYLLLIQLPNLQEFGLDLSDCVAPNSSEIQLFPTKTKASNKNPNASKQEVETTSVQLPHLRSLYLNHGFLSVHKQIGIDILQAAINLQNLSREYELSTKNFYILQSLGKLGCLQDVGLELGGIVFEEEGKYQNLSSEPLVFQLRKFQVFIDDVYTEQIPQNVSACASFLTNLFETSKDTLIYLYTDALGFLQEIKLPRFSRLRSLRIPEADIDEWTVNEPIIPFGIKLQDTFPVLNSLVLEIPWATAFPREDCIAPLPLLEELKVVKEGLNNNSIAQISVMCPNLIHFDISDARDGRGPLENFPEVGTAIWTHLKKLQSLSLQFEVGTSFNPLSAAYSCIIGISKEDCQQLYYLHETEKLLSKFSFQAPELEEAEENVSILELKDLKKLTLRLFWFYNPNDNDDNGGPRENKIKKNRKANGEDYSIKFWKNLTYEINRKLERM